MPRKGRVPPQLAKFVKKRTAGSKRKKKGMPSFLKKKLGRKTRR